MEPSAAIAIIETDLRALTHMVYGDAWSKVLTPQELDGLTNRQVEEAKRRAPVAVPRDLLAYTHFYELRKILVSDWNRVAPALGKKRDFEVWADQVEDFRNAPAHSRELLWHERSLLEGIAGMIRVKVTKYRSTEGPDTMHYPMIEHVEDSFGNAMDAPSPDGPTRTLSTGLVLLPGDIVRFRARATDPQDRELTWKLSSGYFDPLDSAVGSEVELTWKVTDEHVGGQCWVDVEVRSAGRYHRKGGFDQAVSFAYRVDPPPIAE